MAAAILDTGTERLSNSESPFHPIASHQVSAQFDTVCGDGGEGSWGGGVGEGGGGGGVWRRGFKYSKMANIGPDRTILAILNLHNSPMHASHKV